MIGGGKTGGTCADHQHALARQLLGLREGPAFAERMVAQKAFDGVDADRFIELAAVAGGFTRVVAHAAHTGRQRIVFGDLFPRRAVITAFSVVEPRLALFAGRALRIARRKTAHIDRAQRAPGTGAVGKRRADIERNGKRFAAHSLFSSIKWYASVRRPERRRGVHRLLHREGRSLQCCGRPWPECA